VKKLDMYCDCREAGCIMPFPGLSFPILPQLHVNFVYFMFVVVVVAAAAALNFL